MIGNHILTRALIGFCLLVICILLAFSTTCDNSPHEISTELGQIIELRPGQTASIEAEELKVKFAGVISDSRCPVGAKCVWAGEVTLVLEVTHLGSSRSLTLIQSGLDAQNSADFSGGFEIEFDVEPYPDLEKE